MDGKIIAFPVRTRPGSFLLGLVREIMNTRISRDNTLFFAKQSIKNLKFKIVPLPSCMHIDCSCNWGEALTSRLKNQGVKI